MSREHDNRYFKAAMLAGSLLMLAALALGLARGGAQAQADAAGVSAIKSGGLGVPGKPKVNDVVCVRQCVSARKATPGATVRVAGRYLSRARHVVFTGRSGPLRARYQKRKFSSVRVAVPKGATNGRPFVVSTSGFRSNRSPRQLEILPVSRIPKEVFPVRGTFNYGSSGARFGAGRTGYSHQGQDVMAACGTRLVSIRKAKVLFRDYHSAAGHYVVLRNLGTNTQFAYMHLRRPSRLRPGQVVGAGQLVGFVGQTGRAYGCHLHFEYWVGAWQRGGRPIDPLPYLRSLQKRN
jgi:murein DD-endopeptidase MepM/ murein hydrolase activator NlpD